MRLSSAALPLSQSERAERVRTSSGLEGSSLRAYLLTSKSHQGTLSSLPLLLLSVAPPFLSLFLLCFLQCFPHFFLSLSSTFSLFLLDSLILLSCLLCPSLTHVFFPSPPVSWISNNKDELVLVTVSQRPRAGQTNTRGDSKGSICSGKGDGWFPVAVSKELPLLLLKLQPLLTITYWSWEKGYKIIRGAISSKWWKWWMMNDDEIKN